MANKALIIIDMLNDFILPGAPLEVPKGREIIPAIQKLINDARDSKTPIFYLCDAHKENDKEFAYWPPHAIKGSDGAKIVKELSPKTNDIVIEKNTLSAFHETRFNDELKRLKVEELILTGVCTNICVQYAAFDGMIRGYKIYIPENAVAALSDDDHKNSMSQMTEILKNCDKSLTLLLDSPLN